MKVVFLESVEGTAQVGEVKVVKNGFARNYLLPRKLAAPAVEPYLGRAEARAAREAKQQVILDGDAVVVAEQLEGKRITLSARVGEQGKLFGSVTSLHIAQEVAKLLAGEEFDHRKVLLPEAIKEVGVQPVRLRLTRNVEAAIEVEVLGEDEDGNVIETVVAEEADEAEAAESDEDESAEEPSASVEDTASEEESSDAQEEAEEDESVEEPSASAEDTASQEESGDAEEEAEEDGTDEEPSASAEDTASQEESGDAQEEAEEDGTDEK